MANLSTHRLIQLSILADTATAEAAVNTRAAANAISIGNRTMCRSFMARSTRLNMIAIRALQRIAQ